MNYLIDTHVFLWWMASPEKLSEKVLTYLNNNDNNIYLSPASSWEIMIKFQLKKLELHTSPEKYIPSRMSIYNIKELPITHAHTLYIDKLPLIHRDPFDRIILSQSKVEKIPLITKDATIKKYSGKFIW